MVARALRFIGASGSSATFPGQVAAPDGLSPAGCACSDSPPLVSLPPPSAGGGPWASAACIRGSILRGPATAVSFSPLTSCGPPPSALTLQFSPMRAVAWRALHQQHAISTTSANTLQNHLYPTVSTSCEPRADAGLCARGAPCQRRGGEPVIAAPWRTVGPISGGSVGSVGLPTASEHVVLAHASDAVPPPRVYHWFTPLSSGGDWRQSG